MQPKGLQPAPHGRNIDRDHLEVRELGAYLVIPGNAMLRAIRRPAERMNFAVRVLRALQKAQTRILAVIDDTAIELNDKHDVSWPAIGHRVGVTGETMRLRAAARRKLVDPDFSRRNDKIRAA